MWLQLWFSPPGCVCAHCLTALTSKVGSVAELGLPVSAGEHADAAVLDEVHLAADGALPDDEVVRLEHLEAQLDQDGRHKVGVRVGKQGHVGHQTAAVEADDFLQVGVGGQEDRTATGEKRRLKERMELNSEIRIQK